jgi:hypothetical protein
MSFLNKTEYNEAKAFSEERLVAVTDIDVYRYLANKAYSTPEPDWDNLPEKCRFCTIIYHKKAIPQYMPWRHMEWDEIQKEGNPTKSQAFNDLIKEIERHEVRGTGVATAACRHIEWDKYIMLLLAVRLVFSHCKKAMYMILAVITLQCHFIGQINNIVCLATTSIQQNLLYLFCLQLKMRKSKNIRSKRDMPMQIFFAPINPRVCPVLNLAVYIEMFGTQGLGRKILIGRVLTDFLIILANCLQVLISKQ